MSENQEYVLRMQSVGKEYYGNRVLDDINLDIRPGEIHGIVGENGAGKSTLMNILFGMSVIHATGGHDGTMFVAGEEVAIRSPMQAMELGIGMVHQEFMLIPGYTITENIKLNREITKDNIFSRFTWPGLRTLDVPAMNEDARSALRKLHMSIEEWAVVAGLPVGHMQFIEIAREIDKTNLKLLVFDEPTAVLTESEAENLLSSMRILSAEGIAILFITHRLHEIMSVCDNITVLRDGRLVARRANSETDIYELAELMVGSRVGEVIRTERPDVHEAQPVLSVREMHVQMPGEPIRGVSIDVLPGEILGVAGLAGQGKLGMANGIMGLYAATGEVIFQGQPIELNNTAKAIEAGLAFVSEDRRGVGLLLDSSVELNIVFTALQRLGDFIRRWGPFRQLDGARTREHALRMIDELDIRCLGPAQVTRRLSGGNQQKVCIARALSLNPTLLFVSEPTRGIDVGAKKRVLQTLVKLNEEYGVTIVMTSSELAELRSMCDRIAIVTEGRIAGILLPSDSDIDYGLMMAGEYEATKAQR